MVEEMSAKTRSTFLDPMERNFTVIALIFTAIHPLSNSTGVHADSNIFFSACLALKKLITSLEWRALSFSPGFQKVSIPNPMDCHWKS